MKRKHWILAALLVSTVFLLMRAPIALTAPKQPTYERPDNIRIVRVMLTLRGKDQEKARQQLLAMPGVIDVKIDEQKKEAIVRFDLEKTDLKALDEPLRKAGFIPWYH